MDASGHFEFHLQLAAGHHTQDVLQQTHVVVFQPDFTKVIGHLEHDAVVILTTGAQGSEPKIVSICTEPGTKMFLRGGPKFVGGSLHRFLPKARFSGILFTSVRNSFVTSNSNRRNGRTRSVSG